MNQWYKQDEELYKLEIESMHRICPEAHYGFLLDKSMYWRIPIYTQYRKWTVLVVYDCDYKQSQHRSLYGIRVYPLDPSYKKMKKLVENAQIYPDVIPHTYRDQNGNVCLDVFTAQALNNANNICFSVAKWIPDISRWLTYFDVGINNPNVWDKFCGRNNKEVIAVNDKINRVDDSVESPAHEECMDCIDQKNLTPLERWIQKSPQSRFKEIEYLENARFQHQLQVTDAGDVQQVLMIDKWMFLMVINKTFPKETENFEIPIKICLVAPNLSEFEKMNPGKKIPCVEKDGSGVEYLHFPAFQEEYERYLNGQLDKLLTEAILFHVREWVGAMLQAIRKEKSKRASRDYGIKIPAFMNRAKSRYVEEEYFNSSERRSKYVDGRKSITGRVNSRCKKIVMSDRAYIQIFNESQSRIQTETGGLLLGHFDNGVWYVIEASDPGINAKFYNAYHEGDDVYENHVCGVISRTYKYPLVFLGMWHRHPGSFDSFSGTDDSTNYKYAGSAGNGCISAIINYDPEFRITFYYVEQNEIHRVHYTKVDVEVGDDKIPNKEMLKVASIDDVMRRRR